MTDLPASEANDPHVQPAARRRWDPVVKLTHWGVVAAVLANALFTEEGSNAHIWVGYALASILALRMLWGLVGPAEARFSAFPPNPFRALAHVRDVAAGRHQMYRSHNPLGAMMVYAIWSTLGIIIASGIAMAGVPSTARSAPLARPAAEYVAGDRDDERHEEHERGEDGEAGEWIEEAHEIAVNLLYVLILLHIAGVVFETRRSGRRIILAMLPHRR